MIHLDAPWQDTPSPEHPGWRERAANLAGDTPFAVDHTVCSHCGLGWVEQPYTMEKYQRCGPATAGLKHYASSTPGLSWHTLGSHFQDSQAFWTAVGTGVPGSYQRRDTCPHTRRMSPARLVRPATPAPTPSSSAADIGPLAATLHAPVIFPGSGPMPRTSVPTVISPAFNGTRTGRRMPSGKALLEALRILRDHQEVAERGWVLFGALRPDRHEAVEAAAGQGLVEVADPVMRAELSAHEGRPVVWAARLTGHGRDVLLYAEASPTPEHRPEGPAIGERLVELRRSPMDALRMLGPTMPSG
jgi:hypothetical protein